MTRVAVLDYGMGNLRSAEKALEHVGADVEVTRDHDAIRAANALVLPGVGAFPKAMLAVRALGFDELVPEALEEGVPVLGICLGMQLLFESSTELGGAEGIGVLRGSVEALPSNGLKIPHIGWNPVSWRGERELNAGLPDPCPFYHVHSFAPRAGEDVTDGEDPVLGTAEYGGEFVSAVARPPVYGVQFHPEKSGPDGLRLLANFVRAAA